MVACLCHNINNIIYIIPQILVLFSNMIYKLGKSALLAKRDLRSAYRILPIRIEDFPLFGIKVGNNYYVDKFLAMGLSQSANLFEKFATFLHWLVANKASLDTLDHLLDDFIFAGKKGLTVKYF